MSRVSGQVLILAVFKRILSASIIINIGLLLGRLLGFVREILIADGYGASWQADVTVTVLTLPDILINILVGGALTAALVPSFTADKAAARALAYQASIVIFLFFLVVAGVLAWQAPVLVDLLAPGYSGQTRQVAEIGVAAVVLLLPIFVLTGVTTALLQARERFAIPSLGTFFFNGVLIVGLWMAIQQETFNVMVIVLSVFAAGTLRYVSQLVAVRPGIAPVRSMQPWLISGDLVRRYWQAMLSGGILFVYPVAARAYASLVGEGGVAMFSYAMRLIELPLLLCVSFLGVVLLPRMSEAYGQNRKSFIRLIAYGLQAVFLLGTVAIATLFVGRQGYAQAVYGRGLQPEAMQEVVQLVGIGLLCVLFQGAVTFMTAAFNAARQTQLPLAMNLLGGVGLFLALQAGGGRSLLEIMMALTFTYGLLALVYSVVLGRRFPGSGPWRDGQSLKFMAGVLLINVLVAAAHWWLLTSIAGGWLSVMLTIVAGVLALVLSALCHRDVRARIFKVSF
ncbi:murein biosynthesis integral membrane protein MurJ [Marinobacter confluentis]|uniref:Virulence factor MviN n=1 Tax=Marinobacter confluentis TaxID=1697557 RepID=A0A4Z1BCJ6_9GAMM|nr:lipid II flippase MurJ [Marinobacter confluentis]TGN39924.1 hypothetical protein E5Q11_06390 [Marinobacter confluentis]